MPKLNIDGMKIDYEIIDTTDKVILIKPPYYVLQHEYESIIKLGKALRDNCDAKYVLCMCKDVDFETMDIEEATHLINGMID